MTRSDQHLDRPRFRHFLLRLPSLSLDLWDEPLQRGVANHARSRNRSSAVLAVLPAQNARGAS